jgi:DNA-directed RNA polymerase subunit M/transcription elongation factor TFIIS
MTLQQRRGNGAVPTGRMKGLPMSLQQPSPETMKMTVPCPECEGEMGISAVTPTTFGNTGEDIVYRCRKCGFIRTGTIQTPWSTYRFSTR